MLIKLIMNGQETEWEPHTKKRHRELLEKPPEAVLIHLADIYPGIQDKGRVEVLSFDVFNALMREFVLEENRQKKRDVRHLDIRPLDSRSLLYETSLIGNVEDEYLKQLEMEMLYQAIGQLTPVQRRRLVLRYYYRLTEHQISKIEGSGQPRIHRSLVRAVRNLKIIIEEQGGYY